MMKIIFQILLLLNANLTVIAQYELQEQSPQLLRKNKIEEIKLQFISDTFSYFTKSESYNKFGFNTADKIYDRITGVRSTTYKYRYINDTILFEKETFFDDTLNWFFKTLTDFNNNGYKIKENFISQKLRATAFTDFFYDKHNRLKSFKNVRRGYGNLLKYENNLWYSSPTKFRMDTLYKNDTIKKITTKIDNINSITEQQFVYNKDNTIKEITQLKPSKFKISYTYDRYGNNTSRIKKQGKSEFKIFECEYDSLNRPNVSHNFFESEAKIISIGGMFKVNNNDQLTTKVFYQSNGLIDYKEQYLNGHYFGKLEYIYTKKHQ